MNLWDLFCVVEEFCKPFGKIRICVLYFGFQLIYLCLLFFFISQLIYFCFILGRIFFYILMKISNKKKDVSYCKHKSVTSIVRISVSL